MYHATLRINGKTYMGIGSTRSEARMNACQLIAERVSGGLACMTKRYISTEAGMK